MDPPTFELLQFVAGLLPFVALIAGLWGYRYYQQLRARFIETLQVAGNEIRRLESLLLAVRNRTVEFSENDPEPYGDLARKLNQELAALTIQCQWLRNAYIHLQELRSFWMHLSLSHLLKLPSVMKQASVALEDLEKKIRAEKQRIVYLLDLENQLRQVGWVTATECQKLLGEIEMIDHELEKIHQRGVGDAQSELAVEGIRTWKETLLTQIPAIFFTEDARFFDERVDRESVSRVHRTIKPAQEEIERFKLSLTAWKNAEQLFHSYLDVLIHQQSELKVMVQQLETNPVRSVKLSQTAPQVEALDQAIQAERDLARSISQFNADNERLADLINRQRELQAYLKNIVAQVQQIVTDGDIGKLSAWHSWARNAAQVIADARAYHPENWGKRTDFGVLSSQLSSFASQIEVCIAALKEPGLSEPEVLRFSELLNRVSATYQGVSRAYEDFYQQYQAMQRMELESKDALNSILTVSKLVNGIVESNGLLQKNARKPLERLVTETEQLSASLNQRDQGVVQKKYVRVQDLSRRFEEHLRKWSELLDKDLDVQRQSLTQVIDSLQNLVSLSDPVYQEGISLLQSYPLKSQPALSSMGGNSLVQAAGELKEKNTLWQKVVSAKRSLDEISAPVLKEYQRLEKYRHSLVELMRRADRVIPERLTWPPTTQRLTLERDRFQKLELQFDSLKRTHHKAVQLMGILGELLEQYHELFNVVTKTLDQAAHEQKYFKELEQRFHESNRMWRERIAENQANKLLVDEVEALLESCERDYQELQKRYESGGLTYQQAYQMFRVLCRKIDQASVQVSATQMMDITGHIHPVL